VTLLVAVKANKPFDTAEFRKTVHTEFWYIVWRQHGAVGRVTLEERLERQAGELGGYALGPMICRPVEIRRGREAVVVE
jgi:ribosomal protein L15E